MGDHANYPRGDTKGDRDVTATVMPFQSAKREQLLEGMGSIIRRMTRTAPRGDLVLADYDERELSIALLSYLEGIAS